MEKKKVCFVAQFPPPMHGLSKAVETLYNSCLTDKFEFEKINTTDNKCFLNNIIAILKSDADVFYLTLSQTKFGNIRDLFFIKLFQLKKKKYLFHLHGGYYRELIENNISSFQKKLNYRACEKSCGVIVLGSSLKYIFSKMCSEEKIYVVPNCVDDQFVINDIEFEKKMNSIEKQDIKRVLYLSNFIESKGYKKVLEMACLEKKRVESGELQKFHFDFAGKFFDDKDEKNFFEYIEKNEINDYITYHGIVHGEKKQKLLVEGDIFVLLTNYPKEGQPISILEAMGSGMVILTTNHAGIPDIVKDMENGFIVEKNNIDIKLCYQKLLGLENKQYDLIGRNNRKAIKNDYSESKYLDNMGIIFSENV